MRDRGCLHRRVSAGCRPPVPGSHLLQVDGPCFDNVASMPILAPQTIRFDLTRAREAALELHRRGEDPFRVTAALSAGFDSVLRDLFAEHLRGEEENVALVAVGGYGRRELCPHSDIDILFVRRGESASAAIGKMVLALWDSGAQLGHAVRTPGECLKFMLDDLTTANTMLESRHLAGSEKLYAQFRSQACQRYRRRRADSFIHAKLKLLHGSIDPPQRTIYVIEPNVKEGMCGLRDIQRVLWIEDMRAEGAGFDGLLSLNRFSKKEVAGLRDAYGFYLRLRCELHFSNNVHQDILERDTVLVIARNLGYGDGVDDKAAVERLMGDYYRHARNVYRFLRLYLQTDTRGRSPIERILRWLRARKVNPHLSLYKERLYLAKKPPEGASPETILEVFSIAQERDARISEALCSWIRRRLSSLDADFAHIPDIARGFRAFLRGRHVGRILKTMHATGFLDRVLPEFGKLDCLVNFDGHHQFTVDEHTLKTLEELDRIGSPDYPERPFQQILLEIKDHLPLRIALLLHDVGKAIPGEHSVSGTEAATLICERLGLDAKTIETVDFLIYHHLELFRVSELRDFTDDKVIEALARLVGSEERLKMLYLLTYVDIVSVGPGTWTQWKGAQLAELYERTLIHLSTGPSQGENLEVVLSAAGLSDDERVRVHEHCRLMGAPTYAREVLPERMVLHVKLVERFRIEKVVQVETEGFVGYHEVTFCGADRPRLFADLAGVLYSEGLSVLGARIFSRSDGVVIDIFQVEVADTVNLPVEERVGHLRRKIRRVEAGQESIEGLVLQRSRSYRGRRWPKPLFGPKVTFDNEISETASVIEVSAGDRPGLLYDLATALHRLGLDVRAAKVSTLTDRAHDVFYVTDGQGRKIEDPERRSVVSQTLFTQAQRTVADLASGSK